MRNEQVQKHLYFQTRKIIYKDRDRDKERRSWNSKAAKVPEKYSWRRATNDEEIQRIGMVLNIDQKLKQTGKI